MQPKPDFLDEIAAAFQDADVAAAYRHRPPYPPPSSISSRRSSSIEHVLLVIAQRLDQGRPLLRGLPPEALKSSSVAGYRLML
jgi:hypothetical protein